MKKVIAGMVAFLLIGAILFVTNTFIGNPISRMLVSHNVKEYVNENYSDLDLELGKVQYNFKFGDYYVEVKSKTSMDTHFRISCTGNGKIRNDSYESDVLNKFNTWIRVYEEYRELVDKVLESDFTYESEIAYGEIYSKSEDFSTVDGLEIDMEVDITNFAKEQGHLVIYSNSDILSEEVIAERLLFIKKIFDKNKVPFKSIDCVIQMPLDENKVGSDSMAVNGFLYEDIYEDGLLERVKDNVAATKAYYEEMDKMKDMEIQK